MSFASAGVLKGRTRHLRRASVSFLRVLVDRGAHFSLPLFFTPRPNRGLPPPHSLPKNITVKTSRSKSFSEMKRRPEGPSAWRVHDDDRGLQDAHGERVQRPARRGGTFFPPSFFPPRISLLGAERQKHYKTHPLSPLFSFRAGRGCRCRNKTHTSDHQSNQNNPGSLTTNPSIFQTVSTLAHVPLEPPPLRASSRSLSLSAGIEAQDEHGADAAESEELAAAKAVLDEVEPMLEA